MRPEFTKAYLPARVKLEPVVFRWPLWPHLIPPTTYAMNLAFRLLPNLASFVANPAVHVAASKDLSMAGGPFVCLPESAVPTIKELIKLTTERCAAFLEFARDFKGLAGKLQMAKGFRLDAYYAELPRSLAGALELVYDLNNNPRIRLIEELVYDSLAAPQEAYELCVHAIPQSERPFFMSTPRIDADDRLFVKLDFGDSALDELTDMRRRPGSIAAIAERLGVPAEQRGLFSRFFEQQPPVRRDPDYGGQGVRMRYFGHACVLLQTDAVSVLIDPLTAWERNSTDSSLTFDDLPDSVDYVVISHPHQDHMVAEVLLQLRRRIGVVIVPRNERGNLADPSPKLILKRMGFRDVHALDPFESIKIPDGEILALPFLGEHAGLDIASKSAILVRAKQRAFLFLIDSDAIESTLYTRMSNIIGPVDALFIGMECHGAPLTWLYGPLLTSPVNRRDDESRRLSGSDCRRATEAVRELACSRIFVYAMGQEPWLQHIMGVAYGPDSIQLSESDKFIEHCREAGIPAERLFGSREITF